MFERDGVYDLIDGDVYTSEIPWTKPSPHAFRAAMDAVGVTDPARCVYVGDRLFDDVWGAQQAGLRAVHIPLSSIPPAQVGPHRGNPRRGGPRPLRAAGCARDAVNFMFWHCINMRHGAHPARAPQVA